MSLLHKIRQFDAEIKEELAIASKYVPARKDIIIVVKDQVEYAQRCVESVVANTKDYKLWIFDNASGPETERWLNTLPLVVRSPRNLGFIIPNNEMVAKGKADYIILLNSDTMVRPGWDEAMIAKLQQTPGLAVVGYQGGLLDENGQGGAVGFGGDVDYISGWCMCFPRGVYNIYGLFDQENLKFAYGEDADFCLRLREAGHLIYALHLDLAVHAGHKTIQQISQEQDVTGTFKSNHEYIKKRWGHYLKERQ